MGEKGISRRSFLKWSAGALASVALLEFERPARAFAAEAGGAAPSQRFPPRPSRSRGSRRSSRRTWQSSMPMRRASKRAVCAQRYRACSRIYLPRHARVRRRRAGMRAQPSGQREYGSPVSGSSCARARCIKCYRSILYRPLYWMCSRDAGRFAAPRDRQRKQSPRKDAIR